jgi:glycosyltransferase involved in cell wall biosynthesis
MAPLVGIVMPVWNCARTVCQALASVVVQPFVDWELWVVDDGSVDKTVENVLHFCDPRVRVIRDGRHLGLAVRLNQGIHLTRAKYVARMDGDDISYPERLARQVEFLERHPEVDLVGAAALVFGADGRPIGKRTVPLTHSEITCRPNRGFGMIHPTWMGKTEWFRKYRYRPEAVRCEDHDLLYRSHRESTFANLPEILLGYREEKVVLRKVLRSRWYWIRTLRQYTPGVRGRLRWAIEATVAGAKACVDCLAVVSGLQHRLLRHRAGPLAEDEIEEWQRVWRMVQEAWVATARLD